MVRLKMKDENRDFSLKWRILCAVMIGGFMASVDSSIVNLILPTLVKDLNTDFSIVQWVVVSYLLTVTTLILIMGRLGDMVGKKKVYLSGFVLFTAGSVLCGLATSVYWLIGFRVLQGVGGTMILALGFAVATEAFPPAERGKAMGLLASVVSMGVIVGPVIGGFLVDFLSWHWIFFVNLPIGLLGSFMVVKYVPDSSSQVKRKFDFKGATIFFMCMFSLLMGLTFGQRSGFEKTEVLGLLSISLICALLFIVVEMKSKSPVIDLKMFKNVFLSVNLLITFLFYFAISGVFVLAPFYLQNILGYMANQMGLLFGAMSIMMVLLSPVSGILSDRLGTSTIIISSLLIMMLSYFCLSMGISANSTTIECIIAMLLFGTGMGLFMSPSHSAVMGAITKEYLGIISGLLILARTLGQVAGVSILGTIWSGRVRFYNGGELHGGITMAPVNARIEGLQDISLFAVIITAFSLLLIAWGVIHEKRSKSVESSQVITVE